MIKLDHITQTYKTPEGREFKALDDVSIEIRPGEIFGIIGRSGAGKSTLVRCINLLNRPSEGTVTVDGKNLTELSEDELRESRRSIGMIFQHFNLLSSRTVYDNVALPLESSSARPRTSSAKRSSRFSSSSASPNTPTSIRPSSPAARSSASASPAP